MKAYIDADELLVTATIPAAAGKRVTITALPSESRALVRYAFVEASFDENGVLLHESWPVGVLLRCGSDRIVERGSRGIVIDAMYRFAFDDPTLNFTVRLPGVGGGVVDVDDLARWDDEGIEVTYKDGEELYDGMTMAEIRELIDQLVGKRVADHIEQIKAANEESFEYTRQQIQAVLDVMNGPDATLDSVKEMFWLLNDVLEALIEATGVNANQKSS